MTGVEAISNGVPAFKPPEWKNARSTLMVMGTLLGIDVPRHVVAGQPRCTSCPSDNKTVISQIAKAVFGSGASARSSSFAGCSRC